MTKKKTEAQIMQEQIDNLEKSNLKLNKEIANLQKQNTKLKKSETATKKRLADLRKRHSALKKHKSKLSVLVRKLEANNKSLTKLNKKSLFITEFTDKPENMYVTFEGETPYLYICFGVDIREHPVIKKFNLHKILSAEILQNILISK